MKVLGSKKLIIITVGVILVIIGIIATSFVIFLNREGVAVNSGTFSATPGGAGFVFGVSAGGSNGIFNVYNNTWRVMPYRANGNSRIDYTFTAANLEAMAVRSTNTEGKISLTFTQEDVEITFDITGEFYENINLSDFQPGSVRLRLHYENARNVDTLISW